MWLHVLVRPRPVNRFFVVSFHFPFHFLPCILDFYQTRPSGEWAPATSSAADNIHTRAADPATSAAVGLDKFDKQLNKHPLVTKHQLFSTRLHFTTLHPILKVHYAATHSGSTTFTRQEHTQCTKLDPRAGKGGR